MFKRVVLRIPFGISRSNGAAYHSMRMNPGLMTEYESVTDYGSYKNNIFTHRLPESTAQQSPPLVALHSRLGLPSSYSYSTLSQALNLNKYDNGLANNFGLNTLGKTLLSYYVSEYLLMMYPRIPMPIHNAAVDAYMGVEALSELARSWGIEVDKSTKLEKYLAQESEFVQYGKLRFMSDEEKSEPQEDGVTEILPEELNSIKGGRNYVSRESSSYASAVRSIIGGIYTHAGEDSAKGFIYDHVLSRKLDLGQMFQFSRPTRELARLCEKLEFEHPLETRLIAETGRLSNHAIFVAGAFVGVEKLGEGIGSSLQEARTRAVVNALLSYYLYSPISSDGDVISLPSDKNFKFEGIVGPGDVAI